ncbi:MAG: putative toxin-antitoxin system toxin component, PIN family [Nitrospirae bacterium]|nr:putative toxin-antitoxin system toxin component, PIN family [Nitrospirota bacterium]MBF0535380.1 putative toxin-antitoxin system toxin component, PIN family [Nitrospirota bacterium]MBF0616900.1 putative toxin-antitoxin system toxin component, PIN family [Nitrospirota bacterium]
MLKIVLDANIFISAILNSHGKPAQIFDLLRTDELQLITSTKIISEVKKVAMYPKIQNRHKKALHEVEQDLNNLFAIAEVIEGGLKIEAIPNDPTDNKYLECALEGRADFIISGDHHLLDLKVFQGVEILKPEEFLYRLNEIQL